MSTATPDIHETARNFYGLSKDHEEIIRKIEAAREEVAMVKDEVAKLYIEINELKIMFARLTEKLAAPPALTRTVQQVPTFSIF